MKLSIISLTLLIVGCNMDVDTSDPMASISIAEAKKNNFFIKEYQWSSTDTNFKIREAWIEYTWKNEVEGWKTEKEKTGGIQLAFTTLSLPFNGDEYLLHYRMQDSTYGYVGTIRGSFVLRLQDSKLPDTLEIQLNNLIRTKSVCTIFLTPK